MWKLLLFRTEIIYVQLFLGNLFLGGELQIHAKNSTFDIFWEHPHYEICEHAFKLVSYITKTLAYIKKDTSWFVSIHHIIMHTTACMQITL